MEIYGAIHISWDTNQNNGLERKMVKNYIFWSNSWLFGQLLTCVQLLTIDSILTPEFFLTYSTRVWSNDSSLFMKNDLCHDYVTNANFQQILSSSFTSMTCSSLSNVASSSFFHYNSHFATKKIGIKLVSMNHKCKSSKSNKKFMKNLRRLRRILHYLVISRLVFKHFPTLIHAPQKMDP